MERIVITITSELFDEANQEASVRANLAARTLMAEIRKEFNLPEGNYTLRLQNTPKPLDLEKTLDQLGIQTGAVLLFNRERRPPQRARPAAPAGAAAGGLSRKMFVGPNKPFLRDEATGHLFEIDWQPAIIGRPDANNPASADLLAVNLGQLEEAKSVSRQHARISEQNGQYFLESMNERNPTFLNDSTVQVGERRMLQTGNKIRVGRISLVFGIKGQTMAGASSPQTQLPQQPPHQPPLPPPPPMPPTPPQTAIQPDKQPR